MIELFSCFILAVALSMDTFSLSLGLGTYNIPQKKEVMISVVVGVMHFLMPFLGNFLGTGIVSFFSLNSNLFLGGILLFIAINLFFEMLKKEEKIEIDLSFLGIFFFAFGVSIDAFSTGLGLNAITKNKFKAMSIFSIVSCCFTYFGLKLGNFAFQKLGKKSNLIGFLLLVFLGIYHICK